MHRFHWMSLAAVVWLFPSHHAFAQDLMGAEALLEQVGAQPQEAKEVDGEADADAKPNLRKRMEAFKNDVEQLPAEEAAAQWVMLADAWAKQVGAAQAMDHGWYGDDQAQNVPVAISELVGVIPGPAAWPTLIEQIEARPIEEKQLAVRERVLKLLAHFLEEDATAIAADLKAAAALTKQLEPWEAQNFTQQLQQIAGLLDGAGQSIEQQIEMLERQILAIRAGGDIYQFDVPDLVTLVGPEKAEALLRQILVLPVREVQIEVGDETKAMARRLALELVDELAVPRWELVDTIDAAALYEAMAARFLPKPEAKPQPGAEGAAPAANGAPAAPAAGGDGGGLAEAMQGLSTLLNGGVTAESQLSEITDSWEYREARTYYILGLIAAGRTDDAAAELRAVDGSDEVGFNLPYNALDQLDRAGFTDRVYTFVDTLLRENPDLPLWGMYMSLAVRSGHSGEMLERAREAAAREGLTDAQRVRILDQLASAQLAADEVDQGVATLQQLLAIEAPTNTNRMEQALKLARLGLLLDRPEWAEQGIREATETVVTPVDSNRWSHRYAMQRFVGVLIDAGRHAQAERLLADQLARQVKTQQQEAVQRLGYGGGWDDEAAETLALLAGLYHSAGRHEDVLTLLDEAPYWGKADLAQALELEAGESRSLGSVAAAALAHAGRPDEAFHVTRAVLLQTPGDDRAYEVLIELRGQEAIPLLDRLFERDGFEERPLIWKAHLRREAGRLDEALATIRRAIAIDPSDGEQGRGDRMRAYAVLADILEARGEVGDASLYRGAVSAIRIAEDADRLYAAGLLQRGIRQYREALTHFADAYCIQSRLAVQLAELGRHQEAAEHFRKAYELMPDSFGRVESHCFGCEGVFSVGEGRRIAEQVFSRLLVETPDKPQVHYLYGYLQSARDNEREAITHYRSAVKLDPDYLNAWKRIASAARSIHLPAEVRDRATLNILRLDPLQRHSHAALGTVFDVSALWEAVEQARARIEPAPERIYELSASAAHLKAQEEKLAELQKGLEMPMRDLYLRLQGYDSDGEELAAPAQVLAEHEFVQSLEGMMQW